MIRRNYYYRVINNKIGKGETGVAHCVSFFPNPSVVHKYVINNCAKEWDCDTSEIDLTAFNRI